MKKILTVVLTGLWASTAYANNLNYEFKRGIAAYKAGDYTIASQKLEIVLDEHPRNLTALYYYGMTKQKLGVWRSAEKTLTYAHKLAPDVPEIRLALVSLYVETGDLEKARKHKAEIELQRMKCGINCEIAEPSDRTIAEMELAILKGTQ